MKSRRGWVVGCTAIGLLIAFSLTVGGGESLARSQSATAKKPRGRAGAPGVGRARARKLAKALKVCEKRRRGARKSCKRKARARYGKKAQKPRKRSSGKPRTTHHGSPMPTTTGSGSPPPTPTEPSGPPPTATGGTPPPRSPVEQELGFTSVTLSCPSSVSVGKAFQVTGTAAPGTVVGIAYTTPTSLGKAAAKADASGRFSATLTPPESGPYGIVASAEGVTSPECLTTAE